MTAPDIDQACVANHGVELTWHNENTFSLSFDASLSLVLTQMISAIQLSVSQQFSAYILECIPSYNALMIVVDCMSITPDVLAEKIMQSLSGDVLLSAQQQSLNKTVLTIPVWYHLDVGPDLQMLARSAGLTIDEVIALHTQKTYTVCALGFAPGFPYLGFVDSRIAMPRLATPRHSVAAGSVGIADNQTGIYPSLSPGGWNIIGRTPQVCFDIHRPAAQASIFAVGQRVRFESVSRETYEALCCNLSEKGRLN